MDRTSRHLKIVAALLLGAAAGTAAGDDPDPTRFGLVVHVARDDEGARVIESDALARFVAEASAPFAGAGLAFEVGREHALPPSSDVLRTNRDRRVLARHLVPRRVNVFLVSRIEDPRPSAATERAAAAQGFEPSGRLAGAHILVRGRVPDTYLIVKLPTSPTTLSHELGHFFGAGHHRDPRNIMSYGREREAFDEHQLSVFRLFARRYVRRRVLRPR